MQQLKGFAAIVLSWVAVAFGSVMAPVARGPNSKVERLWSARILGMSFYPLQDSCRKVVCCVPKMLQLFELRLCVFACFGERNGGEGRSICRLRWFSSVSTQ